MDEGSPCGLVLNHLLPVGQLGQVSVDKVDPSQGGSALRSLLSSWPTLQELHLGAFVVHSLYVTRPLQAFPPRLFFNWQFSSLLQDVGITLHVPQCDSQDVPEAPHVEGPQLPDVLLCDRPQQEGEGCKNQL